MHPSSFSDSEGGSYFRLISLSLRLKDSCITQLMAQGPSRTCVESKEEEDLGSPSRSARALCRPRIDRFVPQTHHFVFSSEEAGAAPRQNCPPQTTKQLPEFCTRNALLQCTADATCQVECQFPHKSVNLAFIITNIRRVGGEPV